jgi:hypothetical protein
MPPQQADGLLDLLDDAFCLGTHFKHSHLSVEAKSPMGAGTYAASVRL